MGAAAPRVSAMKRAVSTAARNARSQESPLGGDARNQRQRERNMVRSPENTLVHDVPQGRECRRGRRRQAGMRLDGAQGRDGAQAPDRSPERASKGEHLGLAGQARLCPDLQRGQGSGRIGEGQRVVQAGAAIMRMEEGGCEGVAGAR